MHRHACFWRSLDSLRHNLKCHNRRHYAHYIDTRRTKNELFAIFSDLGSLNTSDLDPLVIISVAFKILTTKLGLVCVCSFYIFFTMLDGCKFGICHILSFDYLHRHMIAYFFCLVCCVIFHIKSIYIFINGIEYSSNFLDHL